MSKFKLVIITIFSVVALGSLGACGQQTQTTNSSQANSETKEKQEQVSVTLKEDGQEISTKKLMVKKGTTLFAALKENFAIKDQDGFITSIDGHEQNEAEQKYWTFTINDEQVNVGAKDVKLKNKDHVVFDLAKMQP